MRTLFWVLLIFALAVALTLIAQVNTGYAILVLPPWRIDVSFNTFVFLTVALFLIIYFVIRGAAATLALPHKVRAYHQARQKQEAQQTLFDALIAYFEGRYGRAERLAARALDVEKGAQPRAIGALLAAASADAIRNFGKRDTYLKRSELATPDTHLARLMTEANLMIREHRYEDALELLSHAKLIAPKLTTALRLELAARQQLGQHALALPLIDQLEKSEAIQPAQALQLRRVAWIAQLKEDISDPQAFRRFWNKLPDEARYDAGLAQAAVRRLVEWQLWREARDVLVDALDNAWDGTLALEFARLADGAPAEEVMARIQQAEAWLEQHPSDPNLLLALGRLCRRQQLWGKARSYLEASLSVWASAIAHIELARLLTELEESEAAQRHFEAAASEIEAALARKGE